GLQSGVLTAVASHQELIEVNLPSGLVVPNQTNLAQRPRSCGTAGCIERVGNSRQGTNLIGTGSYHFPDDVDLNRAQTSHGHMHFESLQMSAQPICNGTLRLGKRKATDWNGPNLRNHDHSVALDRHNVAAVQALFRHVPDM